MEPETVEIGAYGPNETPEEAADTELDLPPEYCRYHDDGCELADSCLHCPFPQCIYDQPRGRQQWLKKLRAREMARLFNSHSNGLKELAEMFGVSRRTVQRALKVARDESKERGAEKDE